MDTTPTTEPTDIFLWANQTDAVKNELTLELFVFNKNYTPYSIAFSKDLDTQLKAMFIYDLVNTVNFGAGTGLSVRDYELSEAEENVLLRTELEKVGRAETLIHLIEKQRGDRAWRKPRDIQRHLVSTLRYSIRHGDNTAGIHTHKCGCTRINHRYE